jgi:hypothetical protein
MLLDPARQAVRASAQIMCVAPRGARVFTLRAFSHIQQLSCCFLAFCSLRVRHIPLACGRARRGGLWSRPWIFFFPPTSLPFRASENGNRDGGRGFLDMGESSSQPRRGQVSSVGFVRRFRQTVSSDYVPWVQCYMFGFMFGPVSFTANATYSGRVGPGLAWFAGLGAVRRVLVTET